MWEMSGILISVITETNYIRRYYYFSEMLLLWQQGMAILKQLHAFQDIKITFYREAQASELAI